MGSTIKKSQNSARKYRRDYLSAVTKIKFIFSSPIKDSAQPAQDEVLVSGSPQTSTNIYSNLKTRPKPVLFVCKSIEIVSSQNFAS